jgi:biopolymer transport protein ExbD
MQLVEERPARPLPIRITPLIDVVFILLVFFMVTSRLLPLDYLELDNQTRSSSAVTGEPLPELTVLADGRIRHDNQTLTLSDTVHQLQASGKTEVNLATSPETALNRFTTALTGLTNAGIESHWKRGTTPEQP